MRFGAFVLFEKQEIADLFDPALPFLTRYKLISTPWLAVYVHKIWRHDHDRHLHSHPWPFLSLILRGGYVEELQFSERVRSAGSFEVVTREDRHRVRELLRVPTWTLVVRGRDQHSWGFFTEDGWEDWESYTNRRLEEARTAESA